eukprot:TRINITY_DN16030_c0_g1_i4.p1 TRINITY_DN16030_c0_g1~~TRINITY_DN16030_c0_g1_i4.p1  ORF type:complete len:199 (+),score=37.89 TRINITY_DN16030_c0_g1_i4:233-829(+)
MLRMGGMVVLMLLTLPRAALAAARCPSSSAGLVSRSAPPPPGALFSAQVRAHFKNSHSSAITIFWINFQGGEVQLELIQPGESAMRRTYPGHAFRSREVSTGMLLSEHRLSAAPKNQRLVITSCTPQPGALHQIPPPAGLTVLLHDQNAPCGPASRSEKWSCLRQSHHGGPTSLLRGFQLQDNLAANQDCAHRARVSC